MNLSKIMVETRRYFHPTFAAIGILEFGLRILELRPPPFFASPLGGSGFDGERAVSIAPFKSTKANRLIQFAISLPGEA